MPPPPEPPPGAATATGAEPPPPPPGWRGLLARKPWLLYVVMLTLFVLSHLIFLTIAIQNTPAKLPLPGH